ncbi:MAG: hypothetical protein AD742_21485 [Methylibium sp. NZG]|nr:MAG: hypothetical protein AD742_21485 [Methylibium sp. NZG]
MQLAANPIITTASMRHYAGEYGVHSHSHAQVLVGRCGRLELELDGRATYVDAASALILPAGVAHSYLAQRGASVLVIDAATCDGLERYRRFAPPPHWRDPRRAFDPIGAMGELLCAPTLLPRRPINVEALAAAVDATPHADWSSARLAALCSLSVQRFHPRFVELTGHTPGAWVRMRRLAAASRLLRQGRSLEATALQVGYASASALGVALRRDGAVSARELRSRH